MNQLKHIESGTIFSVEKPPKYSGGIWECGDQRFTDPTGLAYEVVPPTGTYPIYDPMQFYLLIPLAARIAIKASTDPATQEIWTTFSMAFDKGYPINMNLKDNRDAIQYFASFPVGSPYISQELADSLCGTPAA